MGCWSSAFGSLLILSGFLKSRYLNLTTSWSRCTNGLIKSAIILALWKRDCHCVCGICFVPDSLQLSQVILEFKFIMVSNWQNASQSDHLCHHNKATVRDAFCWNCSGFTVGKKSGICKKLFVWSLSNSPKSTSSKDHAFSPSSSPDLV